MAGGSNLVGSGSDSANGSGAENTPRFRGVTQLSLDAKGRLAIPARHRDLLRDNKGENGSNGRLVLTADPSHCLLVYPFAAWRPIEDRLMALGAFNEKIRGLQRLLVGHAEVIEFDASGRILVPPALRRYANLDRHAVLVGQGHRFELWDEAQWEAQTAQTIAFPANDLPPELDGFSL